MTLDRYFVGLGAGIIVLATFIIDLVKAMDLRSKRERTLFSIYVALVSITLSLWIYVILTSPET